MRHAEAEYDAPHGAQLGQREFEADRKHQEYHAEFGQRTGGFIFFGKAQRVRPDQDADSQVPEHRRQVQHPERHHSEYRAAKEKEGQFKSGNHVRRSYECG